MRILPITISVIAGLSIGVTGGAISINHQLNLAPRAGQSSLQTEAPTGQALSVYQVQGGNRAALQAQANEIQGSNSLDLLQGNQEDADNLQPALGYGALSWSMNE